MVRINYKIYEFYRFVEAWDELLGLNFIINDYNLFYEYISNQNLKNVFLM